MGLAKKEIEKMTDFIAIKFSRILGIANWTVDILCFIYMDKLDSSKRSRGIQTTL